MARMLWVNTPVVRCLVADDGTFCSVHNESDITFHAVDFDVGFVCGEDAARLIAVMVHK